MRPTPPQHRRELVLAGAPSMPGPYTGALRRKLTTTGHPSTADCQGTSPARGARGTGLLLVACLTSHGDIRARSFRKGYRVLAGDGRVRPVPARCCGCGGGTTSGRSARDALAHEEGGKRSDVPAHHRRLQSPDRAGLIRVGGRLLFLWCVVLFSPLLSTLRILKLSSGPIHAEFPPGHYRTLPVAIGANVIASRRRHGSGSRAVFCEVLVVI